MQGDADGALGWALRDFPYARFVTNLDAGIASLDQQLRYLGETFAYCNVKWGPLCVVRSVDVGASLDQQLRYLGVFIVLCCMMKWGPPKIILMVDVRIKCEDSFQ